jgi:hypothetical protein
MQSKARIALLLAAFAMAALGFVGLSDIVAGNRFRGLGFLFLGAGFAVRTIGRLRARAGLMVASSVLFLAAIVFMILDIMKSRA